MDTVDEPKLRSLQRGTGRTSGRNRNFASGNKHTGADVYNGSRDKIHVHLKAKQNQLMLMQGLDVLV